MAEAVAEALANPPGASGMKSVEAAPICTYVCTYADIIYDFVLNCKHAYMYIGNILYLCLYVYGYTGI